MKAIKTNIKEGIILGWTKAKEPTMEVVSSNGKALSFEEAMTVMSYAINAYMQGYSSPEHPESIDKMYNYMANHFNKILNVYAPELHNKIDPTIEAYKELGRKHEDEFIKILSEMQKERTPGSESA